MCISDRNHIALGVQHLAIGVNFHAAHGVMYLGVGLGGVVGAFVHFVFEDLAPQGVGFFAGNRFVEGQGGRLEVVRVDTHGLGQFV